MGDALVRAVPLAQTRQLRQAVLCVGTLVLEALLRHASTHGARRIWCNARTPARSFYERAGLNVVSEVFEVPGIGPHFVMELARGPA